MYTKLTIIYGNVKEICEHLDRNGYNFEAINCNLYVLEDEVSYVETILAEWGVDYMVNDDYEVFNSTED